MVSSLPVGDGGSQIIMATRGVALGSFDMFHVGHLRALRRASQMTRHLTVAVADDALVEARCGGAPLVPLAHRVEVLGGFGLAFLGGLFVPVQAMPHALASIATWLPSTMVR